MRQLERQGQMARLSDVVQHRRMPSAVFTPKLLLAATTATLRRPDSDRGTVLRELRELLATEARRRRVARKPEFAPVDGHRDAGETEVPEAVAA